MFEKLKELFKGTKADAIYDEMERTDSQFKRFVDDMQGKTIEDIALEYDLNVDLLRKCL